MYKDSHVTHEQNVIPFLNEGDFYFVHGVKALRKKDFLKAKKWLKRAVELSPTNPLYKCQLSVIFTETGSYQKANDILQEVLEGFPQEFPDCYYLMANNYAHLGLFDQAQKYAEMYLEKDPEGDYNEEAGQLLDMLKMYHEPENEDWLFDHEDELLHYQEMVFQHMEYEEWNEALPVLEEMMALFPEHPSARHDYAYALFFSGEQEEAIELEKQWVEHDGESINSTVNLAIFYHVSGERELSTHHIKKLWNVHPIHESQKLKMAVAFARTGYFDEALIRFQELWRTQEKNRVSYYKWYSLSAFHSGHEEKAHMIWKEGCKKYPELSKSKQPWEEH